VIVLDARVLIAHLDGVDGHHDAARSLLEASSGETLGASTISLAETLVAPARAGRLADAEQALRRLGVDELVLGKNAPARLAEMRAQVGLKTPDCCVLLATKEHGGTMASFDRDLLAAARRMGLETLRQQEKTEPKRGSIRTP
jgi:predicted nucleic acid-binding protein